MNKNIILIGFMGCGKSSVARELAEILKAKVYDSDALIEEKFGLSINEIFAKLGEDVFRGAELNIAMIIDSLNNAIIATGGGFYKALASVKKEKELENSVVVYLRAEFEELVKRMNEEEIAKRPLFRDLSKAKELFLERKDEYEKLANLIINVENKDVKLIAKELINELEKAEKCVF